MLKTSNRLSTPALEFGSCWLLHFRLSSFSGKITLMLRETSLGSSSSCSAMEFENIGIEDRADQTSRAACSADNGPRVKIVNMDGRTQHSRTFWEANSAFLRAGNFPPQFGKDISGAVTYFCCSYIQNNILIGSRRPIMPIFQ